MIIESEFCLFYFANCKIISVILRSLFFQKTVHQLTETLSLFLLRINLLNQFVMINEDLVCFTLLEAKLYPLSSKVYSSEKFCQNIQMYSFAFFLMVCITILNHFLVFNNLLAKVRVKGGTKLGTTPVCFPGADIWILLRFLSLFTSG